jgi:hypothetical protein
VGLVMFNLFRIFRVVVTAGILASCGSIPYEAIKPGGLRGRVLVMWVGYDDFVYIPSPAASFTFTTTRTGKVLQPGLMYTDGGSIPRIAQIFGGFSPWGFGPAYAVHDWIFFGRHCILDGEDGPWFDDVRDVSFDESALILAEAIKTLVDYGQVRENAIAGNAISNAVDSSVARVLWDQKNACRRVSPWHIAVAWKAVLGTNTMTPPKSWKLSPQEIRAARVLLPTVPKTISPDTPAIDPTGLSIKRPPSMEVPTTTIGPKQT